MGKKTFYVCRGEVRYRDVWSHVLPIMGTLKDPDGNVIMNETLASDTQPPAPPGYFGFYSLTFPTSVNGTYQFEITNSWGMSSIFQTCDSVVHLPPPPNKEYLLRTFLGFLTAGLYFLEKVAKRR